MAITLDNLVESTYDKIQDQSITRSRVERAVLEAVASYSRLRPRVRVHDIPGDGSAYAFALPSDYDTNFSLITAVEFPADEQDPNYLKPKEYTVYQGTASYTLRLIDDTPSSSDTVRVTYTVPHSATSSSCTVPDNDRYAVAALAASKLAKQLAAEKARTQSSTLEADVVNYLTQVDHFQRIAKEAEMDYRKHMGIPDGSDVDAAHDYGDIDTQFFWGEEFLTHKDRFQ